MRSADAVWRVLFPVAIAAASAAACAPAPGSGGGRLAPAIRLGIPGADNRGVSLAASGERVVIVWAATTEGLTNIYSAVSEDGSTFKEPVRVNDIEGDARVNGEQPPKVALGRDVVVAWESKAGDQSRVRLARSTDGGHTFQPAVTVHSESLPGARGWASLAVDRDGRPHVAWLDGRHAHDGAPSAPHAAGAAAQAHAQHGAMRQDIFEAALRDDGTTMETQVSANVCFCCKTGIATGSDGTTYVAWRHIYPVSLRDMAVARSDDGGRTFSAPVRVSEDHWQIDGCPEDGPSIGVDRRGVLHIVWPTLVQTETTRKVVFYSSSADGGRSFTPRRRVDADDTTHIAAHPQIAVAGEHAVAVWEETAAARHRILIREWDLDRPSPDFSAPTVVSDDEPASYPAAAITTTGSVLVAWTATTPSGPEIRVRRLSR